MLFGKHRYVVSASRRTDIPALYAEWFMDKIRRGFCKVANPYNHSQVKVVSLRPDDVAAVVFWTRYAKPLRPFLEELDERGFNYYFLYTITGYPNSYESGLPSCEECIEDFLALGECIGAEKVIWRYDPVITSSRMHMGFHMRNFEKLALRLSAGTKKVVVTFVKKYRHIEKKLEEMGYVPPSSHERQVLEKHFRSLTAGAGLQIQRCGKRDSFANVSEGKCIDERLMRELFGLELSSAKDPGQPEECRCIRSVDIGRYGSCLHRCVYCYASRNFSQAVRRYREHDYRAEML